MAALTIRNAEKRDIAAILRLWRESGSVPTVTDNPDASALVAVGERRLRARGARRFNAMVVGDADAANGFWDGIGYERQANRSRFIRNLQHI